MLENLGFIRCHKSFLFNLGYIKEYSGRRSEILLINGEVIPVGRKYQSVLHELFEGGMIVIP
jgi:DNA-binding LytR/AlgR family response regulator